MVDVNNAVEPTKSSKNAFSSETRMHVEAVGSSGTEIYSGYYSEEYLRELRGKLGAKVWDEMRRGDAQVAMLLNAICNPIKSAKWEFEAAGTEEEYVKHKELNEACFKDGMDWEAFLNEALTFIPFGFAVFEVIHKVVFDHPKFGTFNAIEKLGFRGQKTIERWNIEPKTGKLISVDQYAFGDTVANSNIATIDGNFLLVLTNLKEGDNYEGISALRPMFGPWSRKNLYLKLTAIGIEKYAVGVVVGTIPAGKEDSDDADAFREILGNYTSHECAYITKPEGWEIDIQKNDFDAAKIKEMIVFENTEMINSVVANFLALGTNGAGGAFALGRDLSDFFLGGIQSYANLIAGALNREIIPNLVKLNYGQQAKYPKLKCSGIDNKAGKELADVIKVLYDADAVRPDATLEDYLRRQFSLPKADLATTRKKEAPKPFVPNAQFGEIRLAENYKKDFNKKKDEVKALMKNFVTDSYAQLKNDLRKSYISSTDTNKINAFKDVSIKYVGDYKRDLKKALSSVAKAALDDARKAVPSKKNLKLADNVNYFDALPVHVRNQVDAAATLISETQAADIEKRVFFQFTSSASAHDDIDTILNDVDSTVGDTEAAGVALEAAASNAVANVYNTSQLAFFFEPEVLDEIESFTFTNEDPVSEICQALDGTTFAVNDPDLDKFQPPLHHNCKSRYVPNLKGVKGNPEIDRSVSVSKKALDSITLSEHIVTSARDLYRLF